MGSCRVVKNPNGNGFTPDSLKSMRDILTNGRIEALKMSRDGEDIPLLSLGIEKMLHKIGDTYHNLDLDKLVPLVEGFLKRLGWDNYIPGLGLYNTMSKKNRHYFETKGSGLQQYTGTGTLEEIKEINRLFLDNTFGSLADIKTEVKLQASNIMINTFIIDRENGNLVLNISEVNKNAREQKLKLFKKVLSYLETKYQDLPQDLYEDGKYTYALQDDSFKIAINELEALLFSTDSARRIEDLYTDSHISEAAKNKYDAAIAWFTLKNFDNFVDTLIGEAFSINPDYRGKMVDEDLYSYADKGHHLITSWTTSDEIILETRINKLALTLINSTPFMTYGSENKSGKYIKFEDYYRIITKIKDLSLNPITTEIAMDSSGKLGKEVKDALSESDWNLIQDKSLRWVINNIRTNPLKFTRIAMQIVNQPTVMAKLGDIFSKEEKDKCWSIYKGIFDPNYKESIKYIQTKADYNSENYYAALTLVADAIYSVNHLQYNDDEGVITLRSLRDLSSDNTRRDLESTILRSNTRRRNYDFQKNELDPYKAQLIKENNLEQSVLKGLSFEIQLGENILQVRVTDMGGTVSYKLNGKSIVTNANFLKLIEEFPELYKFIDLQLKINFDKDTAFRSNYYNVGGNAKELIDLASIVLLNKYVSNIVFKDVKGPKETTKKLKELYPNKTTRPGYDGLYNEMKIIPDSKLEVLERLAKAKTWTTGEAQSSLVRDAEGDALSTLTLSRLLGALASLFEHLDSYSTKQKHVTLDLLKQSKKYKGFNVEFVLVIPTEKTTPVGMNVNHLTRTISIVENLMLDKYNTKAWTRPAIQKDGSQAMPLPEDAFNSFDEFLNFCLEHEYQHTIHPRKEGLTTGEYETMINNYALDIYNNVTSPVKDFSLLRPGFYKGFANIKELKSPLGNKQHTLFTVAEYIQGEFLHNFVGGFMDFTDYSGKSVVGNGTVGILPSVNSDKNTIGIALFDLNQFVPGRLIRWRDLSYEALAEVTRDELGKYYLKQEDAIIRTYNELQQANPGIPLDYENNFKEFNKYCKKNNVKASDKLFNLTLAYNKKNSLAPIKLIDLIHYVKDGKEIKRNNTIKSLSDRYKNKRRYDDFMKLKELDLLQALTDENVAINLFDSFESETPGSWLRDNYKNWVGKNGHNNGKMTLAKITKGGKSFDIVNKIDLQKVAKELGIDISKNLHNLRDVKVEIHPMLQKWNAFDYLLSQEFLLAGVGSHVAHPAKVKTESPIIWNDQNQLYSVLNNNNTTFSTSSGKGNPYHTRTAENAAWSDITLAFAVNFNTKGETLTAQLAGSKDPNYLGGRSPLLGTDKYIPINLTGKNVEGIVNEIISLIESKGLPKTNIKLNIAGNGIYSFSPNITQEVINDSLTKIIGRLQERGITINTIRSGGLTGIDEAGIIAAQRLGIPSHVHTTYNWNFRDRSGIDATNSILDDILREKAFKSRFITKEQLVSNNKLQEYKDRILVFNPSNEYGISELELLELWEDYKKQANRENKILMTSSIRLKELVKNDFTDVITNPSDGTILDHALERILDNEIKEEASRFLAQHKRNVSFTAAMHPFQLNQIDGIPNEYNMAVIDDITYDLYTIMGNTSNHSPFDGATFVNPLVVYWENNSLKGDKAGIDKKQFVHYYDEATGTGGIIKTAGFGITNDRAKGRKFYRTMAYNMMKRSWVNPDGSPHITMDGGILKDYMGNTVDYGPVYFKKGSKYFMREIVRYNGDNTYTVIDSEVDNLGDIIKAGEESIFEFEGDKIINSNYDVWQLFGGWNSMEIGENGTLVPSENSLKLTARAANNYGYKKYPNEVVEDASDIVQPMKMSDIHYMPTVGAIKQGAANINPKSMYYNKGTLNHMRVKMRLAGIQLDKEHHADGSVLSLMTLVISAAAAKGYTLSKSSNVYNALYNITKIGTKDFRDQLGNVTTNPEKFDAAVSNIILLTILNSSANDGNLILNIAKDLIVEFLGNKSIKLTKEFSDKVNENVPYSSREIYPKLVTALTSSLTKSGIKLDISGILAVLNPTQDIVKLYKVPVLDQEGNIVPGKYKTCNYGLLENYFDLYGVDNEESLLQTILDSLPPVYKAARYLDSELPIEEQIGSISNIEIGQYYIIESAGLSEVVYVNMPNSTKLKDGSFPTMITPEGKIVKLYGYKDLKEDPTISSIREYLLEGNDLKSYNVRFNGTIGNGEFKSFQIADLDIVQDFFEIKNKKGQEQYNLILEKLKKYNKLDVLNDVIRRDLQKVWELKLEKAISEKRPTDTAKNMLSMINSFYERPYSIYSDSYQENSQALLFLNYVINSAQKVLHRELQLNLNGISKSDSGVRYVTIGGEKVYIDKKSIKTQAYGAIMPKTFKTDLGLELFDDLETIKNNPDFFVNRLALKFTTKVDNYIDYDAEGNEFEVYNFHLELKKTNGRHIYVRAGLNGALLGNKINIHKYTDENGNVFRRDADGNILYALSSINDEVYMDAKGNEIIVTSPDSTIWKDTNGNNVAVIKGLDGSFTTTDGKEIKHIKDNVYYNTVDGVEIEKIETSGLLFYLDNMEYNSLYINKAVNDTEFTTILRRAASSKNSVANNIANKIKRLGSGEKSLKLAIEKQRELSDMLGDYESLLKINPEGPLKEFYHFANNHITKLGRRMHTSFLKTLNIVAARIPALNQLSFMAMEIEAYDNPDINSAYVSTYQFFLLGSDLDIDAVSLLTFTLNKSGLYVGHSPYYNLESKELAEASENLPFPTGEEVKLIESSETSTLDKYFDEIEVHNDLKAETSLLEKILDRNIGKGLFNLFIKRNGEVKLSLNLDYEENIEILSELLQEKEVIKSGNTFINSMYNNRDTVLTEQQVESLNQLLVDIINKHNLYISKSNTSKRTNIERNWLTRQIYEIISDPINQLEAMSPIDEVTSNAKNLAKKSSKANVLDTFTAGSVANKCLSISENMVGKDGIAVCATGLKSFFALTLLHNTIMGGDDSSAKDALLCNVKIGGKIYNGLANVFTERFFTGEEEYEKENISYEELAEQDALFSNLVKDYLIELLRAADASNDMSALLSLSTDNAKELVLAKINAGTSTIGIYLYGLSLGIPFDTLYKIMTSKLGFRLAELTKGDTFNNDSGTNDIIGALDYIMLEPTNQISRFDSVDFSEYKVMNPSTLLLGSKTLRKTILGFVDANGKYDPEAAQNYLESLRDKVNLATTIIKNSASDTKEADAVKYTIQYNSLIDFAIQYAEDLKLIKETATNDVSTFYNTVYGGGNILTDFEILAMGAHEMKLIGKLLRLNQEIKTNPLELIELVANIENTLVKRASQIRRYNMRHSDGYDPGKLNEEEKTFYGDIITVRGNAYKSKYKIDFERFITDEAYAINKIKLYDIIKAAYNPLKILHEVAHYKGYAESLYMAYKGWKDKSSKFKLVTEEKSRIESAYNIYDSKLKEQVGRNLENMADTFYRSKWMLRRYKPIVIPASTDKRTVFAFTDSSKEATPIYSNREIQLGTKMGDANFKLWMEEIVIPDLKSRFPNNKFLQDLKFTVNPKTPAGTIATSMGLPINMLPRSEYEKDTFNQYKKSFNDLAKERKIGYKDAKGNEYSAQELLFLYSLITTNGRVSQTSLYGIFEDYMLNSVAKDYHNAISKMDQNSEETISLISATYTIDDIIPFSTRYKGGSDRFKEFDKETETITVWEKNSYSEDELGGEEGGYRPKYVPAENSAIIKGFNTDYFLTAIHNKDLRQLLVNEQIYPELSQYEVQIEPLLDGSKRLVNIKAKSEENNKKAELYLEYITKKCKGKLPKKISLSENTGKDEDLDYDRINNELKNIECLNV